MPAASHLKAEDALPLAFLDGIGNVGVVGAVVAVLVQQQLGLLRQVAACRLFLAEQPRLVGGADRAIPGGGVVQGVVGLCGGCGHE